MKNAKPTSVPLAAHFQLSKDQSPKTESEIEHMKYVPYSNAIGSVMYLMVSARPDIAYVVRCLIRYMSNVGFPLGSSQMASKKLNILLPLRPLKKPCGWKEIARKFPAFWL
ncbi:UNVERIFIED_CONTAM: Retrovirus-related Pol polyprotein from transposon TNT 1-94 [Sesamum calycinum]|uniref:Retrovirus-related Pol polyprotein from transposon TNT 1-94 n=1 Tax=Sesamum calycinum TaxID=2727403 RepID=A0AAW2QJJ1_9LAMI